jgi:hypothetical protein
MPTPWLYDWRIRIHNIKETQMRLATAVLMTVALVAGCAMEEQSRADFERHNSSILRTSYQDESMLVFEAKAGAAYPADSESAEAMRMGWLQSWLDRRGLCPDGYEIVRREPITPGQPNFHDMDLRYLLKCRSAAGG